MKTLIPSAAALLLLAGVGVAAAEDVIVTTQPQAVVITPEERTVIREYVHRNPLASINLLGVELNIGSTLPDTVELREVPDTRYRYTVVGDRTVLVDPGTRRVVEVIE
ncbi:hypothetical protein GCM10007880_33200 [Mesorhizobium amorphae]|nr:hypothetical protein GCM10007880_33200 [Mesorhizobium amorphae]